MQNIFNKKKNSIIPLVSEKIDVNFLKMIELNLNLLSLIQIPLKIWAFC